MLTVLSQLPLGSYCPVSAGLQILNKKKIIYIVTLQYQVYQGLDIVNMLLTLRFFLVWLIYV